MPTISFERMSKSPTFPAVLVHHSGPALDAVPVESVRSEDEVEQHIVEEGLKSRDGGAFLAQQGTEGAGRRVCDGEQLTARYQS